MVPKEFLRLVDTLASSVGFKLLTEIPSDVSNYFGESESPALDMVLWQAPHAHIYLCQASCDDVAKFEAAVESAQNGLDELIATEERKVKRVIDGYLLILLRGKPSEEMLGIVRKWETNTRVCRKHIIWKDDGESTEEKFRRLFRTTVLGLPVVDEAIAGAGLPENYDPDEIGNQFKSKTSPNAAARHFLKKTFLVRNL